MSEMNHLITVDAPLERVRGLVSSATGFSEWWAADSVGLNGTAELGFFSRNTIYKVKLEKSSPEEIVWRCESGKEWAGTVLRFRLESSGKTITVRFTHGNWAQETDYFFSCNSAWGALMFRLKAAGEGKSRGPLFLADRFDL